MSETNFATGEADAAVLNRASADSAGSMLRAAREKAGIHVAALAVAIKIPVKKLEALEADQLLGTHDLVFTRALASSVCRTLKIDATPILAALPQTVVRELHVDSNGINAPFTPRVAGQSKSLKEVLTQPWVMLVLSLCAGAAVMAASGIWGHKDVSDAIVVGSASTAVEDTAVPHTMAPVVIPAPVVAETKPSDVALGGSATSQPIVSPVANLAPAVSAAVNSNVAESRPAPVLGVTSAPASDLVMGFRARNQSVWVKVVDAKGEVRLSRNIAAGERVECGGALPLTVVVGKADSVEVEVRGKPFDVAAFTRENVARFEVK